MATTDQAGGSAAPGLRRELKLSDAAAFSIGLVGPVGAAALLGAGAAGIAGRAAFLAFVFALVGVALVAYAFTKLSQHISHTGSVYALVGLTLGPRAGFFAGWALFGAYAAIGAGSCIEIGLFLGQLFDSLGILTTTEWIVFALVDLALVVALAFAEIRVITRSLLISELVGAALVTLLSLLIIIRLATGDAPGDQSLNLDIVRLPAGSDVGTVASAAVFGFLAFAGFEGAAALGEETQNPRREIPRAIWVAVVVVGIFYLLTIGTQSLGYGTDAGGVKRFVGAGAPYGDLAKDYAGLWLADLLNIVASISLFAILLGTTSGAGRVLYALARDAGVRGGVTRLSKRGAPIVALGITFVIVLAIVIGQRLAGSDVLNATFYALTVGTLALLVAYLMATLGAIRFLFFSGTPRAPRWQVVIPLLGVAFVLYTLYKNIFGVEFPYDRFPFIVGVWLLIGLALVVAVPGLAERVRGELKRSEQESAAEQGLEPASTA